MREHWRDALGALLLFLFLGLGWLVLLALELP